MIQILYFEIDHKLYYSFGIPLCTGKHSVSHAHPLGAFFFAGEEETVELIRK